MIVNDILQKYCRFYVSKIRDIKQKQSKEQIKRKNKRKLILQSQIITK